MLEDFYSGLNVMNLVGDRLICKPQAWWLGRDRALTWEPTRKALVFEVWGLRVREPEWELEKRGWRWRNDGALTVMDTVRGIERVTDLWMEIISLVWTCPVREASNRSESKCLVNGRIYGTSAQWEDRTKDKRYEKLQHRGDVWKLSFSEASTTC